MSELTILQKNGITNMVCRNEDCHTPEISCPWTIIDQCECPTLKEVIETLAHYRDLEEQGRLIVQECGQWIDDGDFILCPICGNSWNLFDNCTETFDYCPKCGAKLAELKGTEDV